MRGAVSGVGVGLALGLAVGLGAPGAGAEERAEPLVQEADPVFAHYLNYAERMRRARYGRGAFLSIVGGGTVAAAFGAVPEGEWARGYMVFEGGFALGVGLFNLLMPTPPEQMIDELRAGAPTLSAEALHERWRGEAKTGRKSRYWIGVLALAWGVGQTAVGAVAVTVDDDPAMATFGFVSGAFLLGAGAVYFIVPSVQEQSLKDFETAHPGARRKVASPVTVQMGMTPTLGGAAVTLSGTF